MTLLLVFVAVVFTLFALWLAAAPFLGGGQAGLRLDHLDLEIREIELLTARRQVLLTALRTLDFERETDKLVPGDYDKFHRRYEREAVSIMRRLDEIHGGRDWEARVAAQLEDRLGRKSRLTNQEEPDEESDSEQLEEEESEVSVDEPSAQSTGESPADDADELALCSSCAELLEDDDRFCSQCGAPVQPQTPTAEQVPAAEVSA